MMASQTTDLPRPSIQVSADDLSSEQKLALRSTSFMKSNWLFRNSSTFSAPYKTWPSWRPTHHKLTDTCQCPTIHQSHLIYHLPHKHTHLWNHVYSDIITCASLEVYVKQPASHSSEHWLQSGILIGRVELCFYQTEIVRVIQPQFHSTGDNG